jgi:hypothetical protein
MLIGVVSDTHNNLKNIEKIISLFNGELVELVIHTGDIANANSLKLFQKLNSKMIGVYGNNDRNEIGLQEIVEFNSFEFQNPPKLIRLHNRNIAIFHEPDEIEAYISEQQGIDIVLHGHTHRYREEILDKILYFNPGESAGMQKGSNAIGLINLDDLKTKRIFF